MPVDQLNHQVAAAVDNIVGGLSEAIAAALVTALQQHSLNRWASKGSVCGWRAAASLLGMSMTSLKKRAGTDRGFPPFTMTGDIPAWNRRDLLRYRCSI